MNEDRRPRFGVLIIGLAAVSAVALILAGWALLERFNETDRLRTENQRIWHGVVCSIEIQVLQDQKATPLEQERAIRFYDGLLITDVHAQPCHLVVKGHAR